MKNEVSCFNLQHEKIVNAAKKVGLYLYEFSKSLKEMKESKLYIEGGFSSFEEYCNNALGIKKSQAYSYCQIADKYSQQFFQSNGKIGVTKLLLLGDLSEEEAQSFIDENKIENLSVKSIKRTLANYKDKKEENITNDEIVEIVESYPITSFGSFIHAKRLDVGLSYKELAQELDVSISMLQHFEHDRRTPSYKDQDFYYNLISILKLNSSEIDLMYKLVDESFAKKKIIARSTAHYINSNPKISKLLRLCEANNVSDEVINKMIKVVDSIWNLTAMKKIDCFFASLKG